MKINTKRLRKLALHLINGKLGHEKFDFSEFNRWSSFTGMYEPVHHCGTTGCAAGECPVLWPKQWEFDNLGLPLLKKYDDNDCDSVVGTINKSLKMWFGLKPYMVSHLFFPSQQCPVKLGGKYLSVLATKEEVAMNMLEFVSLVKRGEIC